MTDKAEFDPRNRVAITKVDKRGDWYTVEGVADGKRVSASIPAPTLESRAKGRDAALIRRTLLGTSMMDTDGGSGTRNQK